MRALLVEESRKFRRRLLSLVESQLHQLLPGGAPSVDFYTGAIPLGQELTHFSWGYDGSLMETGSGCPRSGIYRKRLEFRLSEAGITELVVYR